MKEVDGEVIPPYADLGPSDHLLAAIASEVQHEEHLILALLQIIHYRLIYLQSFRPLLVGLVLLRILLFRHDLASESVLMRLEANGHIMVVDVVSLDVSGGTAAATAAGIC